MDLGLAGKVFVVTAASGGLGRATADQLVAEGAKVVLVARRPEQLEAAVAALGPDSTTERCWNRYGGAVTFLPVVSSSLVLLVSTQALTVHVGKPWLLFPDA